MNDTPTLEEAEARLAADQKAYEEAEQAYDIARLARDMAWEHFRNSYHAKMRARLLAKGA